MNINKFENFVALVEQYAAEKSFKEHCNELINLSGISSFREYISEAIQYIDDPGDKELSPLKGRLINALKSFSDKEIKELNHSLLTSYYTPGELSQTVSKNILQYLENAGKDNIAVLEPSAGSGIFINAFHNSNLSKAELLIQGVEKDIFTFKILENNVKDLQQTTVVNLPFENYSPENKFDAIIGNIPFGTYKAYDTKLSKEEYKIVNDKIHNYFFLKSAQHLHEGGILALITSKELADSLNDKKIREYLTDNLNLITSIRFPDKTFSDSKTSVVTDLLVFQKPIQQKQAHNVSEREKLFLTSRELSSDQINKFYIKNPQNVLGHLELSKGIAGKDTFTIKSSDSYQNIFFQAGEVLKNDLSQHGIKALPNFEFFRLENIENRKTQALNIEEKIKDKHPNIQPGNLFVLDSQFYKAAVNPEFLTLYPSPFNIDLKDRERTLALIELRDKFKELREIVREKKMNTGFKDFMLEKAKNIQNELNQLYDNFNFFYNNINSPENYKVLKNEEERQVLYQLEKEIIPGEFQKSEVFNQNFLLQEEDLYQIDNVSQAIYLSLNKFGNINEDFISNSYNKEKEVWIKEALDNKDLYLNPIFTEDLFDIKGFELSVPSKFLSGWIEGKLGVYNHILTKHKEKIKEWDSFINRNHVSLAKEELIKVIPHKLTIKEIDPSLGEPWIDNKIFELFGKEHFQDPDFKILYNEQLDRYKSISRGSSIGAANYNISSERRYINYTDIFNYALMQNAPEFTKKEIIGDKEVKISDIKVNTAVQMAVDKVQNSFSQWLFSQDEISKRLENLYHLLNNAIVKEKIDSSHLRFEEIKGYTPYNHQKECALEKALNNGGIIDHKVGCGKTLTMAMAIMLKKKYSISNKELVVGLNANFESVYNTFCEAFPEGNFLLVKTADIDTDEKAQKVFYKIANNSYDAVITSHSALQKFPPAPYTDKAILEEIINEIKITIQISKEYSDILSSGEMRRLTKRLNDAEIDQKRVVGIINSRKETGSIIFDDLGFKGITIDESQYFKNLEFSTRHSRVAGLGTNQKVQKTRNLLSYIRNVQNVNKNVPGIYKGITFATGTTISNSLSELYTLFRYLIPEELAKKSIKTFDQWARVYCRKSQEYEESVTGSIKQKERFRYFVKVPELSKMYYDMTHFVDDSVFKLDAPELDYRLEVVETFPEQAEYLEAIKKFGATKNYSYLPFYKSSQDSKAVGLICTSLGRKASLSLKLINPALPDNSNDKLHKAIEKGVKYYKEFDNEKGTQLFFCDQGVPGAGKEFDVYSYFKQKLVERGIPANEIAFIHSYDKNRQQLYDNVNAGQVRIVLGSTEKMGVGVNMQKKIIALHHLDFPWRPSDLDQRNGRGGRPGNILLPKYDNKLPVHFYATKNTLDSYSFNLLQIKQNFINQIKNSSVSVRRIDEGAIDANGNMNFSEYMAACSPNQYLTEKLKIEKELQKAMDQKASFEMIHRQTRSKYNWSEAEIKKTEVKASSLESDYKKFKKFNPKIIEGVMRKSDAEIAFLLKNSLQKKIDINQPGPIANLDQGFTLMVLPKNKEMPFSNDNFTILVQTPENNLFGFKSNNFTKKEEEVAQYSFNALTKIKEVLSEQLQSQDRLKIQSKNLKEVLDQKFQGNQVIEKLKSEIDKIGTKIQEENTKIESGQLQPATLEVQEKENSRTKLKI